MYYLKKKKIGGEGGGVKAKINRKMTKSGNINTDYYDIKLFLSLMRYD